MIKKVYRCDICGKESESELFTSKRALPCWLLTPDTTKVPCIKHEQNPSHFFDNFDLCPDCITRLDRIIMEQFAEIYSSPNHTIARIVTKTPETTSVFENRVEINEINEGDENGREKDYRIVRQGKAKRNPRPG